MNTKGVLNRKYVEAHLQGQIDSARKKEEGRGMVWTAAALFPISNPTWVNELDLGLDIDVYESKY